MVFKKIDVDAFHRTKSVRIHIAGYFLFLLVCDWIYIGCVRFWQFGHSAECVYNVCIHSFTWQMRESHSFVYMPSSRIPVCGSLVVVASHAIAFYLALSRTRQATLITSFVFFYLYTIHIWNRHWIHICGAFHAFLCVHTHSPNCLRIFWKVGLKICFPLILAVTLQFYDRNRESQCKSWIWVKIAFSSKNYTVSVIFHIFYLTAEKTATSVNQISDDSGLKRSRLWKLFKKSNRLPYVNCFQTFVFVFKILLASVNHCRMQIMKILAS